MGIYKKLQIKKDLGQYLSVAERRFAEQSDYKGRKSKNKAAVDKSAKKDT